MQGFDLITGGDKLGHLRESIENQKTAPRIAKALAHYVDFLADKQLHAKNINTVNSYNFYLSHL